MQRIYDALKCGADRTMLLHLSSRFYSIIPHLSPLDVIDSLMKVGTKVEVLGGLSLICGYAESIQMELTQRSLVRNYLDECYATLGCELKPLPPSSLEFELVESYIFNSFCCYGENTSKHQVNGCVVQVFRIHKPSEDVRFEPFRQFANRRVLWHGTRMSNWFSILRHGLLIKPPGVPHHGSAFGAGIYFTDKITRAMAYSHPSGWDGDRRQVFLLSEVALGNCKTICKSSSNGLRVIPTPTSIATVNDKTHHSYHGVGRCVSDVAGEYEDKDGAIWPLGKATPTKEASARLPHNEFVVYNAAQVRMRYLVVTNGLC